MRAVSRPWAASSEGVGCLPGVSLYEWNREIIEGLPYVLKNTFQQMLYEFNGNSSLYELKHEIIEDLLYVSKTLFKIF